MRFTILLLLIITAICFTVAQTEDQILVSLPDGNISGHVLYSPSNKSYYAFQEIPYAAPPVGDLRFQPPIPPEKWTGVLDTTQNTKICFQIGASPGIDGLTQTEDCLYLNVYTPVKPNNASSDLLPVLIWVHGGSFLSGTGAASLYKPQFFIDQDIIVVTINYRLGPLGFLTTEDNIIPGNIGLRDQNLAFQWVKKNIDLFGGDPEKIAISGESAGGAAVGLHVISQRNEGLFRAAIIQSNTAICTAISHQNYARFYAFQLGISIDSTFTSNSSEELLELLRSASVSDIINNTVVVDIGKETGLFAGSGFIWLPVIEDENLQEPFLTGPYHDNIKNGNINQVPILIGFNSEEQLFTFYFGPSYFPELFAAYFDDDLSNLIRYRFNMTQENKLIAGRKLREIYTDGLFQDDVGKVINFVSDEGFSTPIVRHAKLQSNYTDVYLYQFSYKGEMGGWKDLEIRGVTGVAHTEELAYMWDARFMPSEKPDSPEDLVTRNRLLKLWSNFVKYLNPTPEEDDLLENIKWDKVTPNNLVYLNINNTLEMQINPKEYLKYESIIDKYAIPPLIGF